jgi:ankyrin repeat protein
MKRVSWFLLFIGLAASAFSQDLFSAARDGDLDQVKNLVEKAHVGVDVLDPNHATPLFQAIENNQETVCSYLIEKGARLDIIDSYGLTPLAEAINSGNADATRLLLEKGADYTSILNIESEGSGTPLDLAVANICDYGLSLRNYNLKGSFLALSALCEYDQAHGRKQDYGRYKDNHIVAIVCDDLAGLKAIVGEGKSIESAAYLAFWVQKTDILDWLTEIGQFDPNNRASCSLLNFGQDTTYFEWADKMTDPTMKNYLAKFKRTDTKE